MQHELCTTPAVTPVQVLHYMCGPTCSTSCWPALSRAVRFIDLLRHQLCARPALLRRFVLQQACSHTSCVQQYYCSFSSMSGVLLTSLLLLERVPANAALKRLPYAKRIHCVIERSRAQVSVLTSVPPLSRLRHVFSVSHCIPIVTGRFRAYVSARVYKFLLCFFKVLIKYPPPPFPLGRWRSIENRRSCRTSDETHDRRYLFFQEQFQRLSFIITRSSVAVLLTKLPPVSLPCGLIM